MKTLKIIFILLIVLTNSIISSFSQEENKTNKNYSFNVVLDMNCMSRKNDDNFKFLINKNWDYDENGIFKTLDRKSLHFVRFEYKKAFEKGFDHYDRVPIDTLRIKLNDFHLDTIFRLTTELMTIDKNLNVTDKKSPEWHYDGKYASVKLELEEYSTRTEISLAFDNEHIFQIRFNKLLDFLNSIKDN
jgi:hypothetical protein